MVWPAQTDESLYIPTMSYESPFQAFHSKLVRLRSVGTCLREKDLQRWRSVRRKIIGGKELSDEDLRWFDGGVEEARGNEGTAALSLYKPSSYGAYPITIMNLGPLFWVNDLECGDCQIYFASRSEAEDWARWNWDYLTTDDDDDSLWENE